MEESNQIEIFTHCIVMATPLNIEKHDVPLPNIEDTGKLAFILLNVFTPEECQQWIEMTEERGYVPALIDVGTHQTLRTDIRNNDRCMIDDVDLAKKIFERIKSYLPNVWKTHQLVGLNERLRFLRYGPGQAFKQHMGKKKNVILTFYIRFLFFTDGRYCRGDASFERSYIVSFKASFSIIYF
jgi:hypothetical protein